MKKQTLLLAFVLAFLVVVAGCAGKKTTPAPIDPDKPQPALKTGKQVQPLKGCQELRARGGAC